MEPEKTKRLTGLPTTKLTPRSQSEALVGSSDATRGTFRHILMGTSSQTPLLWASLQAMDEI